MNMRLRLWWLKDSNPANARVPAVKAVTTVTTVTAKSEKPQSDLLFSLLLPTGGDLPMRVGKQVEGQVLVSMT